MRSFDLPSLLLSLSLVAPLARSQAVVSPAHFANAEAVSSNSFPLGVNVVPFRYLQIHDDLRGTPRTLKGLSQRRNAQSAASGACSVTVDVFVSTSSSSVSANANFDLNHGNDKTQVVTNKTLNFPATLSGSVPTDFVFDVPFDAAWLFAAMGSLGVEIRKTARTNTIDFFLDADNSPNGSTNPQLSIVSYGAGCKLSSATANLTATGASAMNWPTATGILRVTGANGPANSVVIVVLGGSNTAFGSIPLPFLLPGSGTAPSGPCNLYTDMVLIQGSATTATGTSTTDFAFPATPDLNGIRTFEQILAVDPAANPSGVVASNGVNHDIVAPYGPTPGARVYLSGSLGAMGTVGVNFLVVTRFNL